MVIWMTFVSYVASGCEILNENGSETDCSCDDQGNRNGTCIEIINQVETLFKCNCWPFFLLTSYCAYNVGNGNQTSIEICNEIQCML